MITQVTLWLALALLGLAACGQAADSVLFEQTQFSTPGASAWEKWAPRTEISPALDIDAAVSRTVCGPGGRLAEVPVLFPLPPAKGHPAQRTCLASRGRNSGWQRQAQRDDGLVA